MIIITYNNDNDHKVYMYFPLSQQLGTWTESTGLAPVALLEAESKALDSRTALKEQKWQSVEDD